MLVPRLLLYSLVSLFTISAMASPRDSIRLEGEWQYSLIGAPSSIPGEGKIILPSTLDESHKSIYNPETDNTSQLRREYSFIGEATYSKNIEIPQEWENRDVFLILERTKPASIRVDGKKVGNNSRILSAQYYNLSDYLNPGRHLLEISVNNADSLPPMVAKSSHAASESTQTNWNGILGNILLESRPDFHINSYMIDDAPGLDTVRMVVDFSTRAPSGLKVKANLDAYKSVTEKIKTGASSVEILLPVDREERWSASIPRLHELKLSVIDSREEVLDEIQLTTGFRKFSTSGKYFTVDEKPVFLRGTVNAAVFPNTTYAPTDLQSWKNYFSVLKDYGLNHVRFHTWSPPEAAFTAADELGFYILVELPIWGELDRDLKFHNRFLREELKGIMDSYAFHPSFVMFSPGNELWGDISLMGEYMKEAKMLNPRVLSTYGSNVYLGMNGEIGGEDFVLGSKISDKETSTVRGSMSYADSGDGGYLNSNFPNSTFNFSDAVAGIKVPVISHEVGQYQAYPDFYEIDKYRGNLQPDNLREFQRLSIEAGTFPSQKKYHRDSGEWAAKLYQAEMEAALRSEGIGGFELFGIQDYPGQGTALVGILNPFMESKGFISPEKWKQSSNDLVLLAEFPKFVFTTEENVEIPIKIANFTTKQDTITQILWRTDFDKGIFDANPGLGVKDLEIISFKTPDISVPKKSTLTLSGNDGKTINGYDFWIYPSKIPEVKKVKVTSDIEQALTWLEKGEKVILCPDTVTTKEASISPLFTTDFWNYRMYRTISEEMKLPVSPGTLGLSIDAIHPALSYFPTDTHTDWQWYSILKNSQPLIIDRLPKSFEPMVELIDNVERNYRIALILECNVEKGKMIILSTDLENLESTLEGRWLLYSLKSYMTGKDFHPSLTLSPSQLINLLTKPSNIRLIRQLRNPSYTPPQ